jgi:hypothetical protein
VEQEWLQGHHAGHSKKGQAMLEQAQVSTILQNL